MTYTERDRGAARTAGAPTGGGVPRGIPDAATIMARAAAENFPVALRILPKDVRRDLLAVYGFARLADQLGDVLAGDRLAALDWLEGDLERALAGEPQHPVTARLRPVIERHGLGLEPFRDLIEANRLDQRKHRYATFDELLGYCKLSANPVGRCVLAVFDVHADEADALSDRVCTGLQIVEHLQDVAEDFVSGRIYLPLEDMRRFGCGEADLGRPVAAPQVRRLVELECQRARALLGSGSELARRLRWQPRLAVAGFAGGGLAALDAIAAAGFDVLAHRTRPARRHVVRRAAGVALARRCDPSQAVGRC